MTTQEKIGDGHGCICSAYYDGECSCEDADWTPQEVYDLKARLRAAEGHIEMASSHYMNEDTVGAIKANIKALAACDLDKEFTCTPG